MTLLAVRGRRLRIAVDDRQRRHDRHVRQDVTIDTRNGRRRNVIGRFHQLGEVAHHEARVAVRAIRATGGRGRRVVGILCHGRPIHHHDAVPLHTRFMTGLTVVRDADVIHLRARKGHEVGGRVAHLAGFHRRHVGARLAWGMDIVVAPGAVVRNAGVVVVGGTPGQRHEVTGAAFRRRRDMVRPLANGLNAVMARTAGA